MSLDDVILLLASCSGLLNVVSGACSVPGSPFDLGTMSGTVKSPGYNISYKGNEDCQWNLSPPARTSPEILVLDIEKIDTNVDNLPPDNCDAATSYVNFDTLRACGQEGPVCVAFMLTTSGLDCHMKLAAQYSGCMTMLQLTWPFELAFKTGQPDNKAGFKLDYKFVHCGAEPEEAATTAESREVTEHTTEAESLSNGSIWPENNLVNSTSVNEASTTANSAANVATLIPTDATLTTTEKRDAASSKDSVILGVLFGLTGLLLVCAMVLALCRRRISAWFEEKQWKPEAEHVSGQYTSAYVVQNGNNAYEVPMEKKTPSIPAYPPMAERNGVDNTNNANNNANQLYRTTSLHGPLTVTNIIYETVN